MRRSGGCLIRWSAKRFSAQLVNDRGVALMAVLWVMAILMIVATGFVYTVKVDSAETRNFKDEAGAHYLASAGVQMGLAMISRDYDLVCEVDGRLAFRKKGDAQAFFAGDTFELGGGTVSYTVEDESGKININSASREALTELLRITKVEPAERDMIADSILDWIDANDEHHLNGAETAYYSSLAHPYKAKNGALDTTGFVPPELASEENGIKRGYKGIYRYLTVKGSGKLNINTASETALEAALGRGKAQEIMLRRETEGFFEIPAYGGSVSSDTFLIRSTGEVRGFVSGIKAIAKRDTESGKATISYWKDEGVVAQ